jgi:Collagen triple helix repeat (20 copies).
MKTITIQITPSSESGLLTIPSSMGTITTRMDDRAQRIVFLRPSGHEKSKLRLTFSVGGQLFVGEVAGDIYFFTPAITQFGDGSMWVTLVHPDGTKTESSNLCRYRVRDIPVGDSVPPIPPSVFVTTQDNKIQYIRETDAGQFAYFSPLLGGERVLGDGGGGGVDGATFIPAVSDDGVISWTNNGGLQNPAAVNIKGPVGAAGAAGADGEDGQPGEKGDTGATGSPGADGLPGAKGETGANGQDGADGKSAFASAVEAGYTGTEADFYAALLRVTLAITSGSISKNEVMTQAEYDELLAHGEVDPNTAYDIVED